MHQYIYIELDKALDKTKLKQGILKMGDYPALDKDGKKIVYTNTSPHLITHVGVGHTDNVFIFELETKTAITKEKINDILYSKFLLSKEDMLAKITSCTVTDQEGAVTLRIENKEKFDIEEE